MNNTASGTTSPSSQNDNNDLKKWPEGIPIPETFICPLSRRLMVDPVIDKEGNSYERTAIQIYLTATEGISPTGKQHLKVSELIENRGLKMAIEVALQNALVEQKKSNKRGGKMGKRFSLTRMGGGGGGSNRSTLSRDSGSGGKPMICNGFPSSSTSGGGGGSILPRRGSDLDISRNSSKSKMSDSSYNNNNSSSSSRGGRRSFNDVREVEELKYHPTRRLLKKNESFKIKKDSGGRKENVFASFTAGIANALHGRTMEQKKSINNDDDEEEQDYDDDDGQGEENPNYVVVSHEVLKFHEDSITSFEVPTKVEISDTTTNRRRSMRRSPEPTTFEVPTKVDISDTATNRRHMRRSPNVSRSSSRSSFVSEDELQKSVSERPELAMLEHQGIKFTNRLTLDCSDPDDGGGGDVSPMYKRKSMSYSPKRSTPSSFHLDDLESKSEEDESEDSKSSEDELDDDSESEDELNNEESEDELDLAMSEHQDIKFTTISEYKRKSPPKRKSKKEEKDEDFSKSDPNMAVAKRGDSVWRRKALLSQGRASSMFNVTSKPVAKSTKDDRQAMDTSDRSDAKSANPDDFKALENNLSELRAFTRALRRDSMKPEKGDGQSYADDTRSSTADLSWGELSGEIERLQTMSLKSPKNDAKHKRSPREASLEKDRPASMNGSKRERHKSRRDKSDRKSSERKSSDRKSSDRSSERVRRSSNKSAERKSTKKKSSQPQDKHLDITEPTADRKHRASRRRGDVKMDSQVMPSYNPQRSRRRRSRSRERASATGVTS
eukprot:scaffold9463_cov140-Skeletonema_menzelii.AAC.5